MATSGLYGSSPTGAVVAAPGSESAGLYGNGTTFGGTYFEWFIFIQSATQPATPTGGSWSFTTNVGTPPSGWSNTPPSAPTLPVWGSIALVNSANSSSVTWSAPGLFAYAQGLPVLSGADIPLSSDGVNNQLYVQTGSTPQTIWLKESGTWTRLTGSTLYVDLVNNQTIGGTKTFSSQIQGSVSGTASNVSGTVAIANGGTGQVTATGALNALLPNQASNASKVLTTDGSNATWQAIAGSGTVTSVNVSGGTTGLTTSGGPVTTSGTITLAGTLAIANGGTGSTSTTYANLASNVYGVLPVNNGGTGVNTSTGSGSNVLSTNANLTTPTQVTYENWTGISAPTYTEGRMWYDSAAHALAYYNDSSTSTVHIGQDLQLKVINNTGSTIANGSPVYITGTSSGQTYPNIALAKADVAGTSSVIGLTNGSIANGAIGYVTAQGGIDNVNTGTFTVGQVLYLSPYSAGQLMNTIPPTGITVQVGVVSYVDASAGKIYVKQTTPLAIPASIITGQVAIANGGTGQSTAAAAITALTGTQTSGYYLRSNGTNSVLSAIQAADVPTLNQNTTGTAANVTGIVAIANGGTGQSTANAAFNALAPSQTGNSGKYLTTDGTNTSWAVNPLGTVTSVAATVPSFLSISGSPITTSGTLAFGLSGTALPTTSGGTGLTSFTANGVVYASSTSALTTGSALTFDGSKLVNTGYNKSSYQVSVGGIGTFESVGGAYLSYASGGNLYSMLNGSGTEDIFNYRASQHLFYIGGTEQARLTSTGLGLGTNSPGSKLDVKGTLRLSGSTSGYVGLAPAAAAGSTTYTLPSADGTANQALVTNGSGTLSWATTSTGTVTSVAASGGTTGLTFTGSPITTSGTLTLGGTLASANGGTGLTSFTANGVVYASSTSALATGSALTFDGTNLAVTGGSVTAGSTQGNAQLIFGSVYGGIQFRNNTTAQSDVVGDTSGNLFSDFLTSAVWRNSLVGTNELMRLTSTGLGIGTSSPSSKLDIVGVTQWQATAGTVLGKLTYSGGEPVVLSTAGLGLNFYTNNAFAAKIDSSGNLGIGTSSPAAKLESFITSTSTPALRLRYNSSSYYADHLMDGNGNYVIKSPTANGVTSGNIGIQAGSVIQFFTNGNTATDQMRLDSSGNLGLGVTPSAWNTTSYRAIQISSGLSLFGQTDDASVAELWANGYVNSSYSPTYKGTGNATRYRQATGQHQWYNAPSGTAGNAITFTQAMTLDASGNLWVGTTTGSNSKLYIDSGSVSARLIIGYNATSVNYFDANTNIFRNGSSTESARFDSSGNLGIGTTSPNSKLNVNNGFLQVDISGTQAIRVGSTDSIVGGTSNNGILQVGSSKALLFYAGGSEYARFDTSGNFGIGTSSPSQKLEVAGNIYVNTSGNPYLQLKTSGAGNNPYIRMQADTNYWDIQSTFSNTNDELYLNYNGSSKAILDNSGNLILNNSAVAWFSNRTAIVLGNSVGTIVNYNDEMHFGANWYCKPGTAVDTFTTTGYYATDFAARAGLFTWSNTSSTGTAGNSVSWSERMRLDLNGNLRLGLTGSVITSTERMSIQSASGSIGLAINASGSGSYGIGIYGSQASGATSQTMILLQNSSSATVGSITSNGTATLYNTTSDQRLKENIVDALEFGSVIDSIQVRSYDWITDKTHQRAGFIAQELVQVAPEAVHQPKDSDEMMAVDYSKLVPMLVKEIQSLRKRLADAGIA